jgi:hypothetical protein
MAIPSGQSAWTFNSALASAMSSASVLVGLLMAKAFSGLSITAGCRVGGRLSRGEGATRYRAA